jgi:hypothetical protein
VVVKTFTLIVSLFVLSQSAPPSEADWDWLNEHRQPAFDALMPLATDAPQLVAYRRYRDLYIDVPEAHFTIGSRDAPAGTEQTLRAVLTLPTVESIQQQLLRLHMSDRTLPLDILLPRVKIQRRTIEEEQCPSIRARLNALVKVRVSVPHPNVIVLHPVVHHLIITTGEGRIDARLLDSADPAVRWASDTLKTLADCKVR